MFHTLTRPRQPDLSSGQHLLTKAKVHLDPRCPPWIRLYAAFHAHAMANYTPASSSAAKLMLHECTEPTQRGCPGLGDRFRGLMETFKLAVHSGRAFLLRWEASAPLEDVLQPALIDWRVQPKYHLGSMHLTHYHWHRLKPRPDPITSGAFVNDTNPLISLTHPDRDCRHELPGPDIGCYEEVPPTLRSCVFHALFKPSQALAADVAEQRKQLFGSADAPYLAVHLRIGGFEGERSIIRGGLSAGNRSTAEVVAAALGAARDLAAAANLSAPVLVLTDNDELRDLLMEGKLAGFVSPMYKAMHASSVKGPGHRVALMTSFADLLLLAQARCLIGSPSGFTNTALVWGRHTCFLKINDNKGRGITHL